MKNPLPATLWFLQHDAAAGLLEESGFTPTGKPGYPFPLYEKDGFVVSPQGFWYDRGDHLLVYRNQSRSFYRLPMGRDPLAIPGSGEERVHLDEGFQQVEWLLQAHEDFITAKMGSCYRAGLIQTMPRAEQRYAKNWKIAFGYERRSITM